MKYLIALIIVLEMGQIGLSFYQWNSIRTVTEEKEQIQSKLNFDRLKLTACLNEVKK